MLLEPNALDKFFIKLICTHKKWPVFSLSAGDITVCSQEFKQTVPETANALLRAEMPTCMLM